MKLSGSYKLNVKKDIKYKNSNKLIIDREINKNIVNIDQFRKGK